WRASNRTVRRQAARSAYFAPADGGQREMSHALRVWEVVWESPGRASLPPLCSACRSAHAPLEPREAVAAAEKTQRRTARSPSCALPSLLLLLEQTDPKALRRSRSKLPH